jgi:hypothetical protein
VNGFEALAGALSDLADSAEDAVAGGAPPAYVVQQATERARQIAWAATMAARRRIAQDDLCTWLGRDGGDGDTLMLGRPRPEPEPEPSVWHRAWRKVRREISGARAWVRG